MKREIEKQQVEKKRKQVKIVLYMRLHWSFFFSKSLYPPLKNEFLLGKTNKIGFHKEFLTPYMEFEVQFFSNVFSKFHGVFDSTILINSRIMLEIQIILQKILQITDIMSDYW